MFFEWENPNPNNENYLIKPWYLSQYVIYGSTTLFIASLFCLAKMQTTDLMLYHLE